MPLMPAKLIEDIKKALTAGEGMESSSAATQAVATKLSMAIDSYIRSAVVNTTVTTAGTAAAQTGAGVGTLS